MKKYIYIVVIFLIVSSCGYNSDYEKYNIEINGTYFEELDEIYGEGNGYFDLRNGVIELDNIIVLNDLDKFTGESLLVHIGYTTWINNSIEILKKLKELNIENISINIRNDKNLNSKNLGIESVILIKEEAILFSEFKTKNKSLIVTMGKRGVGEIICSDEIAKILGVKKEECSILQITKK